MSDQTLFHKYISVNEAPVYKKPKMAGDNQKAINRLLLGTWVGVTQEEPEHYFVKTAGKDGWIEKKYTTDSMGLKVFFIDSGQGDAILIEVEDKKILVDGGPNDNLKNYLTKWQYTYLLDSNQPIHFDLAFISHFDDDHYAGLLEIIKDKRFSFGTIYHNGIARFDDHKDKRPSEYDTDLGITEGAGQKKFLKTTFDSISDLQGLRNCGLSSQFESFLSAVENAHAENRLHGLQRLNNEKGEIELGIEGGGCRFDVLGPICEKGENGDVRYKWFTDSSHTRNGHSIVLKLIYKNISVFLGGDLNKESEEYLLHHYAGNNPFEADVAKSCHHGASDFSVEFMSKLRPYATVISSGDNESYSHPRADAIGCAGKYSRGTLPKVFSTELARSRSSASHILYGMINLRSNGDEIYLAQMKEARIGADIWDSYRVIGEN